MEPGKQQVVRLAYTGETLAAGAGKPVLVQPAGGALAGARAPTQQSVAAGFSLTDQAVPAPADPALRVEAAPGKLQWRACPPGTAGMVEVFNPTPLPRDLRADRSAGGRAAPSAKPRPRVPANMVIPGGRTRFELPGLKTAPEQRGDRGVRDAGRFRGKGPAQRQGRRHDRIGNELWEALLGLLQPSRGRDVQTTGSPK